MSAEKRETTVQNGLVAKKKRPSFPGMAEASNDAPADNQQSRVRYFCHQCSDSIYPDLPDYTCPECHSGFIEEISEEAQEDSNEPAQQFMEIWERTFLNSLRDHGNSDSNNPRPRFIDLLPRRASQGQGQGHFQGQFNPETPGVDFLINHILQSLTGNGGLMPLNLIHLHGNPGDYAWGEQGLDSIVTQLLNQLEGSGPPPASKDQMEKLPVRTIVDADVERTLQCSVCFEEYSKGERVRCLPCQHVYHDGCIFPWLEKHGTCPVCRKDLEGKDTTTDESQAASSSTTANGFVDDSDDCD